MKRSVRAVAAAICVVLGSVGMGLSPASATHEYYHGYWNRAPYVAWDGVDAGNIQDGAYYWQNRGFKYGYVPPLPGYNHGGTQCTAVWDRYINVCTVSQSIVEAYGSPGDVGVTETYYNGAWVITGGWMLIASGLSPVDRQKTWRHEFGHALGLGHWSVVGCVMHPYLWGQPYPGETCPHDRDAMRTMYP